MKGVVLALDPRLRIVDLTHRVAPQDIAEGAFHLWSAAAAFPSGTVHVAVVDPGVGTRRKAICVEAGGNIFIGPDNGLFEHILDGAVRALEISNPKVLRPSVTATFHGRDVFAPAGGYLAAGLAEPAALGPELALASLVRLPPQVRREADRLSGQIVSIDRFGNCITLLERDSLGGASERLRIRSGAFQVDRVSRTFADVPEGAPVALIGSSGTLELALRDGNAAEHYGLRRGAWVEVRQVSGR